MILTLKMSDTEERSYTLDSSIYSFAVRGMKLINNTDKTRTDDLSLQVMVSNDKATIEAKATLYNIFEDISEITSVEKVALFADNETLLFDSELFNFKVKGFNFGDRADENDSISAGCNLDILFEFDKK